MPTQIEQALSQSLDNIGGSIVLNDYGGGLNTTASNELLRDNEAIIRKNWSNDEIGSLKKVNGYTKANSTTLGAKPIRGLFRVYLSNGTKQFCAVCNGKFNYSDDDGATFTQESGAVALTETEFNSGVNYYDLFFMTNTTNKLKVYTVGTTTLASAADMPTPGCKIILKRTDRRLLLLVNAGALTGSTLYYSKVDPTNAADDWSAANDAGSIAIDGAGSEPLTGGMTFGSYDIIFKQYGAFQVWGYPSPQAIRLPGSPGCVAPYSTAQGDGLGFHLAHDGVYMYDGNKFIKISDPIKNIIATFRSGYKVNAFGKYRDGFYWLHYTPNGATTNTKCLIYDVFHSSPYESRNIWYERDDLAMNCPCVFDGTGDDNQLFAGGSASDGFVYQLDYSSTGADDTANITAIYQTKYFNAGTPHLVKRYPKVHIRYFLNKGILLINWYTNRGNTSGNFSISASQTGVALGSFVLNTDTLAGTIEATYTERLPDTAVGKDISLKFTHINTGTAPIIRNVEIEWESLYIP